MSLKDDFLEALNSVKRDITRDEEQSVQAADELVADQTVAAMEAPLPPLPPIVSGPAEDVVFEAFKQATVLDDEENNEPEDARLHMDSYLAAPYSGFDDAPFPQQPVVVNSGPGQEPEPPTRRVVESDPSDFYSDDKTVISRNTVIRGTLQTEDSVRLLGQVMGDIECKSNIVIAGKVRGNTTAANAFVMDAQVDGSVYCDDAISISSDAWILGNIRAGQADIDGKVKGNLEVRNSVSIGSTSSVLGNISTDELEIKRGAFINGQIMMYTPSRDVIDRFDHFER